MYFSLAPVPTELPDVVDLPAKNLCKDCFTQPTFSGAFPEIPLQSAGSTVKDLCKDQSMCQKRELCVCKEFV